MVAITHKLRKRFVKDFKLPITVLQDPYFPYYIGLYQDLFGSQTKYEQFKDLVGRLDGEGGFFGAASDVVQQAINDVKSRDAYQEEFLKADMNQFKVDEPLPKGNIYKMDKAKNHYVSIDMRKANFTALSFFNPEITACSLSYEDFLRQFTDEEYFLISKQIRQVIFGNLNPKRQQTIQRWIMGQIAKPFRKEGIEILCGTSDEIILAVPDDSIPDGFAALVSDIILEDAVPKIAGPMDCNDSLFASDFRVESFWLDCIGGQEYFIKQKSGTGEIEFKGVPAHYFAEVYKFYLGEEPNMMDRLSFYDGRIVEYKTPLPLDRYADWEPW